MDGNAESAIFTIHIFIVYIDCECSAEFMRKLVSRTGCFGNVVIVALFFH
jgi:hypothetical protein